MMENLSGTLEEAMKTKRKTQNKNSSLKVGKLSRFYHKKPKKWSATKEFISNGTLNF
jgi:hypothetical protein